jgi:hypothetical protein
MVSAQAAYESGAGSYALPECLVSPTQPGCFEGYPAGQPGFIEGNPTSTRSGYRRIFVKGPRKPTRMNPNGIATFCFAAVPVTPGQTGVRSFATDPSGRICFDPEGDDLCAGGSLPYECLLVE